MTQAPYPHARRLVRNNCGAIPTYIIENDESGKAIATNQFTGQSETIGPRPFSVNELRAAMMRLRRTEKEQP